MLVAALNINSSVAWLSQRVTYRTHTKKRLHSMLSDVVYGMYEYNEII